MRIKHEMQRHRKPWLNGLLMSTVFLCGGSNLFATSDDLTGMTPADASDPSADSRSLSWTQFARNSEHTSFIPIRGQNAREIFDSVVFDPHAQVELANQEDLLVHYQSPLWEDGDVYMAFKGGIYCDDIHVDPCNPNSPINEDAAGVIYWETQTWGENKFKVERDGKLRKIWSFTSDWVPPPYGQTSYPLVGPTWEPIFGAALAQEFVYLPGYGGTVYKLCKLTGEVVEHINPLYARINPQAFVTSPITSDKDGNIYYTVSEFNVPKDSNPKNISDWERRSVGAYRSNVINSYLVKVGADSCDTSFVSITNLLAGQADVPRAQEQCEEGFLSSQLPWPPSPDAVSPTRECGSQRAAINSTPAVDHEGNIYLVSRAHSADRYGFVVALDSQLCLKWASSLRNKLPLDGCDVIIPDVPDDEGGCREGARVGVDPATNNAPAGRVLDDSSASPTVAPDGSIYYGAYTRYNWAQGHTFRFDCNGFFLDSYNQFGWDTTYAVYPHHGTYSVLSKENHYGEVGTYCNNPPNRTICPPDNRDEIAPNDPVAYYISQFSPELVREWAYQNTNTESCERLPNGTIHCEVTNPEGFEWCVNNVAVDRDGTAYANSEDGNLYVIRQGGTLRDPPLFLNLSLGAAYTPTALAGNGLILVENFGSLLIVGSDPGRPKSMPMTMLAEPAKAKSKKKLWLK